MSTFEKVVEQVRSFAGADFAFALTRKGRLVTRGAPPNMPEIGRMRLVKAARPLVGTEEVTEVTMPREELVPFGGAAPVDVYVAVADEQAILCVVMATWADKMRVLPAMKAGLSSIEPLLRRGLPKARRTLMPEAPVSGSPFPADPQAIPRAAPSSPVLATPPGLPLEASGRRSSTPEIRVGEAPLGRETIAAIEWEARARGSGPDIRIGEASMGRETIAAIDREMGVKRDSGMELRERPSSPEQVRVELISSIDLEDDLEPDPQRMTQPWVEAPADTKRAVDAAILGRKLAPPRVTVRLEEADQAPASERRRTKR